MLRKTFIALTASAIALTAAACNTVKGVGRDLESAASATEKAIN